MAWFGAMSCGAFICQQQCLKVAKGQPGFGSWHGCSVRCSRKAASGHRSLFRGPKTQSPGLGTHQELGGDLGSYNGEQGARVKQGGTGRERVKGFRQELPGKRLAVFLLEQPAELGPATQGD